MERLLRPYGLVIDGKLELGLELVCVDGAIREIRPHTGIPEPYVISPAFVNAHSHLEYRGLQGALGEEEYWPWIREITAAKREQSLDEVRADAVLAARENREAGVVLIAEHSDRPVAGVALKSAELQGVLFQEVITRFEKDGPSKRLNQAILDCAVQGAEAGIPSYLAAHAYQTVDENTLRAFGASGQPFSMHVAETDLENQLTQFGTGAIAETLRDLGVSIKPTGRRLIPTLDDLGLVRKGAQFVHCCAIQEDEVELLAAQGVSVAHCPRSNVRLQCPPAPIREMLDLGVSVGLGLDSPASSGPIDMFAEMRSAIEVSTSRGRPITGEEAWQIATGTGAKSLGFALSDLPEWEISVGSAVPLIRINVGDALSTDDLIERGAPDSVKWINPIELSS